MKKFLFPTLFALLSLTLVMVLRSFLPKYSGMLMFFFFFLLFDGYLWFSVRGTIKKLGKSDQFINASTVKVPGGDPIYVAISPKYPKAKKLAEIVSQTIKELRASGKLKAMIKRYSI